MTQQDIEVSIKHGTSEIITVVLPAESTVSDLMEKISEKTSLPIENQKLILRGKTISPRDATLNMCGIRNKTRLLLIGTTPAPVEKDSPTIRQPSIPTPMCDFIYRAPRIIRDEYLTAPPHSTVISKGPPDGALEGSNHQLQTLPLEPLNIRDHNGDEAKLYFNSDDVFIESPQNQDRIFYEEITSFGIQLIPGYEQQYLAIAFHVKGKKIWTYFVPKQFRSAIEAILLKRRFRS